MTQSPEHRTPRPAGEAVAAPPTTDTRTTTSDGPVGDVRPADVPSVEVRAADVPSVDVRAADVPSVDVQPADVAAVAGSADHVDATDVRALDVEAAEVSPAAVAATADVRPRDEAGADLPEGQPISPASASDDERTAPLAAGPVAADDEPTVLVTAPAPTGPPGAAEARRGEDPAPAVPQANQMTVESAGEDSSATSDGDPLDPPSGGAPGEELPAARSTAAVPAVVPADSGRVGAAVPPDSGSVGAVPAAAVPPAAAAGPMEAADEPTRDDPAGADSAGADPLDADPAAVEPGSGEPSGDGRPVGSTGLASSAPSPSPSPSPDPDPDSAGLAAVGPAPDPAPGAAQPAPDGERPAAAPWRRLSSAGALIWVLIVLFGFTLVVQLRNNDTDQGLSTARQEDLVRILSDLEAREQRLAEEIRTLEASQRQLTSGVQGRQVALAEAEKRANELGLLAGTLPARGPGLLIDITPGGTPIKASAILNTVQELRGAGGEVMQLAGPDSTAVRVVASSSFVDAADGVLVDGVRLRGPYRLTVIGDPQTMKTALNIPGGVVAAVGNAGGTVIPQERNVVVVTAVRRAGSLQYARPVS